MDLERNKKRYLELLSGVNREGIKELIDYLETTDFFTAPASAKYHSNIKGGLCQHSLNVYDNLETLSQLYAVDLSEDSIVLVSLLHDLAKVDYYEYYVQNRKNYCANGKQYDEHGKFNWVQVGSYKVKDSMERPNVFSEHGVCSYLLANKYVHLKEEEVVAIINHHMDLDKSGYVRTDISEIYNRYPLASLLHIADTLATYINENPYRIDE